jgi:hypothetical protein
MVLSKRCILASFVQVIMRYASIARYLLTYFHATNQLLFWYSI